MNLTDKLVRKIPRDAKEVSIETGSLVHLNPHIGFTAVPGICYTGKTSDGKEFKGLITTYTFLEYCLSIVKNGLIRAEKAAIEAKKYYETKNIKVNIKFHD